MLRAWRIIACTNVLFLFLAATVSAAKSRNVAITLGGACNNSMLSMPFAHAELAIQINFAWAMVMTRPTAVVGPDFIIEVLKRGDKVGFKEIFMKYAVVLLLFMAGIAKADPIKNTGSAEVFMDDYGRKTIEIQGEAARQLFLESSATQPVGACQGVQYVSAINGGFTCVKQLNEVFCRALITQGGSLTPLTFDCVGR